MIHRTLGATKQATRKQSPLPVSELVLISVPVSYWKCTEHVSEGIKSHICKGSTKGKWEGQKDGEEVKVHEFTSTGNWDNPNLKQPLDFSLGKHGKSTWLRHLRAPNKWKQTWIQERSKALQGSQETYSHQSRVHSLSTPYPSRLPLSAFPPPPLLQRSKLENTKPIWIIL